mmetsp:Transcript_25351/g.65808  ORF Transcript_25351/g.65808 Transcript_25351/m.65808 type:complete len:206 (-) Transcript_25351:663-1280(-)
MRHVISGLSSAPGSRFQGGVQRVHLRAGRQAGGGAHPLHADGGGGGGKEHRVLGRQAVQAAHGPGGGVAVPGARGVQHLVDRHGRLPHRGAHLCTPQQQRALCAQLDKHRLDALGEQQPRRGADLRLCVGGHPRDARELRLVGAHHGEAGQELGADLALLPADVQHHRHARCLGNLGHLDVDRFGDLALQQHHPRPGDGRLRDLR